MLRPRKLALVFDVCGFHWPNADAVTKQIIKVQIFTRSVYAKKGATEQEDKGLTLDWWDGPTFPGIRFIAEFVLSRNSF